MRLKRMSFMAWDGMKQRRLRTFLTTLGVVIGITAITGLASLGEGFRVSITEEMEQGFELDVLTVIPGSLFAGMRPQRFTDIEVQAVEKIANVSVVTAIMQMGNATLYNEDKKVSVFVATASNFTEFVKVFPDRFIFEEGEIPEKTGNDTLIIGYKINHANETTATFVHSNDKVNMTVTIPTDHYPFVKLENYSFTIAGTLRKTGTSGLTNFDYWAFMPLETARRIYDTNSSDVIFVKVSEPSYSEVVAEEIEALFPPYQISVLVPLSFIQQVDTILNMVELFLTSIASIALLVAGIGIMNIMTVSVMERTREIGILKAVGAKNRTILTIFLTEAALIGLIGSLVGVPTGYGIAHILSYVLSNFISPGGNRVFQTPGTAASSTVSPIFSWEWAIVAVFFGIIICILFGLYPARKAAKLDPVEALRYE